MPENARFDKELTPDQLTALELLAGGARVRAVAAAAGVDEATVRRWRKLPQWRALWGELARETWADARHRLRLLSRRAVSALALGLGKTAFPEIQLRAAKIVLGAAFKADDLDDLRRELEELLERLRGQSQLAGNGPQHITY